MTGPTLVTGATGFLGSHLCRTLATDGRDVRALCRPSSDRSVLDGTPVEWVVGDVTDADRMRAVTEDCATVYHLAGVGLATASPETVHEVNVAGTRNVLEACQETGVDRMVFTSTAGTRRCDGVADETDVAPPIGAYQESKARAESLVDDYTDRGLDVVTVHPTSVFGPGDTEFTGRLLSLVTNPAMIAYLPGGVSFVSVSDVVDGLQAAMTRGRSGEHYILCGQNLTFRDALGILADTIDGSRPFVPVPRTVVHAAGYVAGAADRYVGRRFFPFTPEMARLSTSELFYSSEKARSELSYTYRPLAEYAEPAAAWYRDQSSDHSAGRAADRVETLDTDVSD